jgi:multidrug efflux pump
VQASVEAAGLRLPRLILMTTGAMVLGAVPLAIATGAGAESRSQIGWVIVGGIAFGTLFTLFVVPTAYTLLARTRHPAAHAATPAADEALPERQAASDHRRRQKSPNRCGRALCDASGSAASGFLSER